MRSFVPSVRLILSSIIGLMGLLALLLAISSGSIHQDQVLANNKEMMKEMIRLKTRDLLDGLKTKSQDLGLSLQNSDDFRLALKNLDKKKLVELLNNQFHQYFVTAGVIKLEKLVLFNKKMGIITESTEGKLLSKKRIDKICPSITRAARKRTGRQRFIILDGLCKVDNDPLHAVLVPVGGLRLKGYLLVLTDPAISLKPIEMALGLPLQIKLPDGKPVFTSPRWPNKNDINYAYRVDYKINTNSGDPLLTLTIAQDLKKLSQSLRNTRLLVLIIAGSTTFTIVLLALYLIRKTTTQPLYKLTRKLHQLQNDQSIIGEQLEVSGTKEIRILTQGFNEMSSRLKELYEILENMAYTDSLTKLPNRNLFQNRIQDFVNVYNHEKKPFAVLLLDLDRFKIVNDTLGHHVGDELLKEVSVRLHNVLRKDDLVTKLDNQYKNNKKGDIVARLGGDEFALICTSINNTENSKIVAEKIISELNKPFILGDHHLSIGASIGIALCPKHGKDINTLIRHADVAMYHAKNTSNGFTIYEEKQDRNNLRYLKLEQDLLKSIDNDEMELYYQPKVDINTFKTYGVEALIRWNHPQYGIISPVDFIPIAEQTGKILNITEWVLDNALKECAGFLSSGYIKDLSINLSRINLRDQSIASTIKGTLEKYSIPPEYLVLELTESAIMGDHEYASLILNRLSSMNVSISIDDFGTGYTSLAHIKDLPVDEIKIDKTFIQELVYNNKEEAVVRAILVLAKHMNLTVVAEGIEDIQTLTMLRELGCSFAQGYYFAKPMPLKDLNDWLINNQPEVEPAATN